MKLFRIQHFRNYPWGLQLLLFLLMCIVFISFATITVSVFLPKLTGVTLLEMDGVNASSSRPIINAALLMQGVGNIMIFGLPALLFAYFAHPDVKKYLGLRAPGKNIQLLLAVLVMLGAMPVLSALETVLGKIDFGAGVKAAQNKNDDIFGAFLNIHSFSSFLYVFVIVAVVPGMGEELFFRGLLMRFAKKRSSSMVVPVLFSAAVFALSHSNIYGMLSIFMAGVLLAVIYNLTGSLWCSMLAHIFFNGSQIALSYIGNMGSAATTSATASTSISIPLVVGGAVLFSLSFYLLLKNKTPLLPNWANDFTRDELEDLKNTPI